VELLVSIFDDIWLHDTLEMCIPALDNLVEVLAEAGLTVNFSKSVVLATRKLSRSERQLLRNRDLRVEYDGITILGTPVGTAAFIKAHLDAEAAKTTTAILALIE
jgi:hypothetical protein